MTKFLLRSSTVAQAINDQAVVVATSYPPAYKHANFDSRVFTRLERDSILLAGHRITKPSAGSWFTLQGAFQALLTFRLHYMGQRNMGKCAKAAQVWTLGNDRPPLFLFDNEPTYFMTVYREFPKALGYPAKDKVQTVILPEIGLTSEKYIDEEGREQDGLPCVLKAGHPASVLRLNEVFDRGCQSMNLDPKEVRKQVERQ